MMSVVSRKQSEGAERSMSAGPSVNGNYASGATTSLDVPGKGSHLRLRRQALAAILRKTAELMGIGFRQVR